MGSASLSDVPAARDLEDYVAALFQSAGYFVEKNIVERDFTEVLELDLIATSYDEHPPSHVLGEAKSGDWGFPDLFKVIGWMKYLEIERGAFFASTGSAGKDTTAVARKVAHLGLVVVELDDFSKASERFVEAGFRRPFDAKSVEVWRFAYAIERLLLLRLRRRAKSDKSKIAPSAALEHYHLINNELFFTKDAKDRLFMLYSAYGNYPKLTLAAANEMLGGTFDPDAVGSDETLRPLFREVLQDGKYDVLQACLYLEHRARLAILKAAVDYVASTGRPLAKRIPPKPSIVFPELPASFYAGIEQLQHQPSFSRYPLLWQVFLWGFGGFYLKDRQDEEFGWLSKQTHVPVTEIPTALQAFDLVFPIADGWFTQAGPTQCVILKMMPAAFRGLGANQRLWRYGYTDWKEFNYGDYTLRDLGRWNNSVYHLLVSD